MKEGKEKTARCAMATSHEPKQFSFEEKLVKCRQARPLRRLTNINQRRLCEREQKKAPIGRGRQAPQQPHAPGNKFAWKKGARRGMQNFTDERADRGSSHNPRARSLDQFHTPKTNNILRWVNVFTRDLLYAVLAACAAAERPFTRCSLSEGRSEIRLMFSCPPLLHTALF